MKLAFVINDIATESLGYTTVRLARLAANRGWDVGHIGLGDFIYTPDGSICAIASCPQGSSYEDDTAYLAELQAPDAEKVRIRLSDYDVMMLRSDPANELTTRPWAPSSGLLFAQIAASGGTIVLNDPKHLTDAVNKTYFQNFPAAIRPATCITRHPDEIKAFIDAHQGQAVIKPLQGSGGHGVFIANEGNRPNLNQIIDAVTRDGYAIAQEYLPDAAQGDLRMLTLNGKPLQVDGTYACIRRFSQTDDLRSNISAGGGFELVEPDERALRVAEIIGPKLIDDGMYLTGLDIVGDKMMEVNVDTPGGLYELDEISGLSFCDAILDDFERKVRLREHYGGQLSNRELAGL